jgi:hypothetical protein
LVNFDGHGPAAHASDDRTKHQAGKPLGIVGEGSVKYACEKHQRLDSREAPRDRQPPDPDYAAACLGRHGPQAEQGDEHRQYVRQAERRDHERTARKIWITPRTILLNDLAANNEVTETPNLTSNVTAT